jgi:hypothetical protein
MCCCVVLIAGSDLEAVEECVAACALAALYLNCVDTALCILELRSRSVTMMLPMLAQVPAEGDAGRKCAAAAIGRADPMNCCPNRTPCLRVVRLKNNDAVDTLRHCLTQVACGSRRLVLCAGKVAELFEAARLPTLVMTVSIRCTDAVHALTFRWNRVTLGWQVREAVTRCRCKECEECLELADRAPAVQRHGSSEH